MEQNDTQNKSQRVWHCNDCGNEIHRHDVFCSKCGKQLDHFDFED
ncbi:MAG: zinc-ribbon domain-containing protein [Bacteroidaceae bacterium]|nr:zinc-ribbon domain-containing protein [Bacteroidaceae bacterium]